jgi:cell division septation protein DedD
VLDTTVLSIGLRGARAQVGDRVYFGTDTGLVGVKSRDLSIVPSIHFPDQVAAIAPTPSGDRLYVATRGERGVSVIDRYTDKIVTEVELPGLVSELRMDPLGRYVIARPVHGDSAWVIAVATDHLAGAIQTVWTADLPACAPDGAIAVNTGRDVVFLDGETLQPVRTVVGGARDFWYFLFWNGFRPRAAGIDQPVSFGQEDSTGRNPTVDSLLSDSARVTHDSVGLSPAPAPTSVSVPAAASSAPPAAGKGSPTATTLPPAGALPPARPAKPQTFSVSFAALLNEQKAKELAASIAVGGKKAHVVSAMRAGTMVYRVVLGQFPSHEAAQQAGQASQKPFWVYADEQ